MDYVHAKRTMTIKPKRPISPKVTAPLAATLSAFAYNSITAGVLDRDSLALLAVAAINAIIGYWVPFGDEATAVAPSGPEPEIEDGMSVS